MTTKPRRCRAVLFDMDGTLLDTVPLIVDSFQHVFSKHAGHKVDEGKIRATIGTPLEDAFRDYPAAMAREMVQDYTRYNHQKLDTHVAIFRGIVPLLSDLQGEGLRLGVVTSKRLVSAEHSLDFFQIKPYFDVVIGKESTRRHKPDPQPVLEAMRRLGLQRPQEVLFVGDSLHDLGCAQRAGCHSAIVDWTAMPKEPLRKAGPDLWLHRPEDLLSWLADTETQS